MDQQKDGTAKTDARQKHTEYRLKRAQTELKHETRTCTSMSSWWAKDDARDQNEGRDQG